MKTCTMKTNFTLNQRAFRNILLLLILSSKVTLAQNWRSIPLNDTCYFRVIAPSYDTMVNGYARSIHLISTSTILNYEVSNLPYSSRANSLGVYDSSTGNSWLGARYILNQTNGEEFFFNVINDTIKIRTHAQLSDSWVMAKDTNGHDFIATIASLDTLTIEGVLDSIKTISVQAYNGITPVANGYNSLQIQLSKNHGFQTVFEFYTFPNYDSIFTSAIGPYPKLQYPHRRLEKSLTDINFRKVDLVKKFQPGNEWIIFKKDIGGFYILHDSILSSTLLNPNKISVEMYRHTYYHYILSSPPQNDTFYHTYSTIVDTFLSDTLSSKLKNRIFETPFLPSITGSFRFFWNHIQVTCDGISVKDTAEQYTPMSGNTVISNTYQSDYGLRANFFHYYNGGTPAYYEFQTLYMKIGYCIEGTKLNFKSLSIHDIDKVSSLILAYPNPANHAIQISNPSNLIISSFTINDILGTRLINKPYVGEIDISSLSSGLYYLVLNTNKGQATKVIIKK
jgi:hypothetical protein